MTERDKIRIVKIELQDGCPIFYQAKNCKSLWLINKCEIYDNCRSGLRVAMMFLMSTIVIETFCSEVDLLTQFSKLCHLGCAKSMCFPVSFMLIKHRATETRYGNNVKGQIL